MCQIMNEELSWSCPQGSQKHQLAHSHAEIHWVVWRTCVLQWCSGHLVLYPLWNSCSSCTEQGDSISWEGKKQTFFGVFIWILVDIQQTLYGVGEYLVWGFHDLGIQHLWVRTVLWWRPACELRKSLYFCLGTGTAFQSGTQLQPDLFTCRITISSFTTRTQVSFHPEEFYFRQGEQVLSEGTFQKHAVRWSPQVGERWLVNSLAGSFLKTPRRKAWIFISFCMSWT